MQNINRYATCTYNTNLSDPSSCIINNRTLIDEGYIDEDDIEGLDSSYAVIACYNSDNTTVSVFYKERRNANCNEVHSHRIHLEPQIISVYYQDVILLTSDISLTGDFDSVRCEVSPDNVMWTNWASCYISSDYKTLNVQFYGQENFPFVSSQNMTIRVTGEYRNEQNNLEKITKNFRLVIFK